MLVCSDQDVAVNLLRTLLLGMEVPNALKYRPHDLRRGHYEDLKDSGKRLWEILQCAGCTSSRAHLPYMDKIKLEAQVVLEAHMTAEADELD